MARQPISVDDQDGPRARADRAAMLVTAETFARLGRRVAAHADTTAALQALVDLTVEIVPGARWVSVTRGLGERFVTVASNDPIATKADLLQYRLRTGPCIDAVLDEAVFASSDLALDDRWSQFGPQAARAFGTRSVLSMRLTSEDDDLHAGLNMYGDHIDAFDHTSRALATLLATHAAVALAAVDHREQSQQLRGALESSRDIGVAMGVLMTQHGLTRGQAFDLLRIAGQNQNRKLREVARDVGDTGVLPPITPPRPGTTRRRS